jgi:hypothetical protein
MRIWKLTPADHSDARWRVWQLLTIIVRADNDTDARKLARDFAYRRAKPQSHGRYVELSDNPWGPNQRIDAPWPTHCHDATEDYPQYALDGPADVLDPKN